MRRQFTLDEVKKQPGKDVNKSEHDLKDSETNRSIDRLFMATNWSSKANTTESSLSSSWVRFRAQFRSLLRIRFVTSAKKCFFLLKSVSEMKNRSRPVRSNFFGSSPVFFGSEVDAADLDSIFLENRFLSEVMRFKSRSNCCLRLAQNMKKSERWRKKNTCTISHLPHITFFLPSFLAFSKNVRQNFPSWKYPIGSDLIEQSSEQNLIGELNYS